MGDTNKKQGKPTWQTLEASKRRRLLVLSVVSITVRVALLITAYYVAPFEGADGDAVLVRVIACLGIIAGAAVLVAWGISRAAYPIMKAVEGVSTLVVVLLIAFASTFVLMSQANPSSFSEELNHTGSLYYVVTTATTIGYGDITPTTDTARIVVIVQMIVNVVLLGAVLRLLAFTAKQRARSA